jgi:hypothetical protein
VTHLTLSRWAFVFTYAQRDIAYYNVQQLCALQVLCHREADFDAIICAIKVPLTHRTMRALHLHARASLSGIHVLCIKVQCATCHIVQIQLRSFWLWPGGAVAVSHVHGDWDDYPVYCSQPRRSEHLQCMWMRMRIEGPRG